MSTKSTIILTNDNEHWYTDCSEPLADNPYRNAISLEFSKENIRVDANDDDGLFITITNPDCDIYQLLKTLAEDLKSH